MDMQRGHVQRIAALDIKPGTGFKLHRMSWLQRTVRYEWPGENGAVLFSPTFTATAQEWERAHD